MQIQLNPLVLSQIYLKKISNTNWILDSGATDVCGYSDADWAGSFDQKINNRFLHICGRKFSHMEEKEIKCRGSIECQSGISSHDINHERIDLDQATLSGYWN
jgi:hypothetical protein